MASPNQQSGSRGNKEDDARPDDDNKALDEKQKNGNDPGDKTRIEKS